MLIRLRDIRWLNLLLCGMVVLSGTGCGLLRRLLGPLDGTGPTFDFRQTPSGAVSLHLINASGLPLIVEASYQIGDQDVRITKRFMPSEGPESEAEVLATVTAILHVTAHVSLPDPTSQPASQPTSEPAGSQPTTSQSTSQPEDPMNLKPGDLIYDRELHWRIDFEEGAVLEIVITGKPATTTSAPG